MTRVHIFVHITITKKLIYINIIYYNIFNYYNYYLLLLLLAILALWLLLNIISTEIKVIISNNYFKQFLMFLLTIHNEITQQQLK